jgi:hypothetical protein
MTGSTDWPRIGPAAYRAATQDDGLRREANPQADGHLMASPQVAKSAPRTLSRWRHGFEPRWDYQRKVPGQGTSPESIGWLNRSSIAEYPANIPHQIERSERARAAGCRGWMHWAYSRGAPFQPDSLPCSGPPGDRSIGPEPTAPSHRSTQLSSYSPPTPGSGLARSAACSSCRCRSR